MPPPADFRNAKVAAVERPARRRGRDSGVLAMAREVGSGRKRLDLEYRRPDLEAEIRSVRNRAELEQVLNKVVRLNANFRDPDIYSRKLFVQWLDALLPLVAARIGLADVPTPPKSNERIVVISTILRRTGGHSQVVKDIMHAFPGQVTGIYTDIYRELAEEIGTVGAVTSEFKERAWLWTRRQGLLDRAIEVYMMLKAIQPTRVLLFGHPMDFVPIVAAWPFREIAEFVHHMDHAPAVGATLPFSSHVDLTYRCHVACRGAGLDAVFAGMTAPPPSAEAPPPLSTGEVVIATCGSLNKYRQDGADFAWTDYAVAMLKAAPNSRIVHLGPVNDDFKRQVDAAMSKAKLSPSRYKFAGAVERLHAELLARGANLYLSSYPESGGKANLEALAALLPVIVPVDRNAPDLSRFALPSGRWIEIHSPDEAADALARARALAEDLRTAEVQAEIRRELGRFDDFVHLRPLPPVALEAAS